MKVEGNIPAYPRTFHAPTDNINGIDYPQNGMSLLDYFAGLAMQDIMKKCGTTPFDETEENHDSLQVNIAVYAYSQAEAMLKARKQYL